MISFADNEDIKGLGRRTAFQYYLTALTVIFIIFFFFDLTIDLITPLWLSAIMPFLFIIPLILLKKGIKLSYLITSNIIELMLIFQLLLILNPKHYYVLIYWIGLIPLLVMSMVKPRAAKAWGVFVLLFILINGIYILLKFPSYEFTLYPKKYLAAGFVFWMITFAIVSIINLIQERNRNLLAIKNKELSNLKFQIENKNEELSLQNKKISEINDKLRHLNENLEVRITERTQDIEQRNIQLSEYAFINSHLLRAPVARIIGLLNLFSKTKSESKRAEILEHLKQSGSDLDDVVSKINLALDEENKLERGIL